MSREIDSLIAEKVMELKVFFHLNGNVPKVYPDDDYNKDFPDNKHFIECPHYSTNIQDSWLVVEKMKEKGCFIAIQNEPPGEKKENWLVVFESRCEYKDINISLPMAICKAALKYLEVEVT